MKKKSGNKIFVGAVIVIIIGAFVSLAVLNNFQEKKISELVPTQSEFEKSYTGEVNDFDYDNQPSIGSEDAPVKIVEFGDYKCPACANWTATVYPALDKEYIETGKAEFYFINFPFLGDDSYEAAMAGEAIYKQNEEAFWKYYKLMFANQGTTSKTWATETYLLNFVKENIDGIDYEEFEKDLKERNQLGLARLDYLIGQKYLVNSTPSVFVNGEYVNDSSYLGVKEAVDNILEQEEGK